MAVTPARLRRHLEKVKIVLHDSIPPGMGAILILVPGDEPNPSAAYHSNLEPSAMIALLDGLIQEMKRKSS